MIYNDFVYGNVKIAKIVDADTIDLIIDLGFHLKTKQRFRLIGINAPEIRGEESAYGIIAKARVDTLLGAYPISYIQTFKADSFGRWLANVWMKAPASDFLLQEKLITEGLAAPWDGKGKNPKPWLTEDYPLLVETGIHVSHPGH